MTEISRQYVESIIDASLGSSPAPTLSQYIEFVNQTLDYHFAATLVEPYYIRSAAPILHQNGKKVVTVISYPLASYTSRAKLFQAQQAIKDGTDELDISMDLSAFKEGDYRRVIDDLKPAVELSAGRVTKMIYFSNILNPDEQKKAAELAIKLGFHFLKTNPGYGYVTKPEDIRLIKSEFADAIKVMASGGVRTKDDAIAMIQAGADRIATSTAVAILNGF